MNKRLSTDQEHNEAESCICTTLCNIIFQNADYTTGQVFDLSDKLEQSEAQLGRGGFILGMDSHEKKSEDKLAKATKDG